MNKIRKGDEVVVRKGRSRGKRGVVLRVDSAGTVLVEGVNLVKRHTKPNPRINRPGGIVEREAPIPIGNVGLYNHAAKKAERVGFKTLEDGRKVRYFKSSGEVADL